MRCPTRLGREVTQLIPSLPVICCWCACFVQLFGRALAFCRSCVHDQTVVETQSIQVINGLIGPTPASIGRRICKGWNGRTDVDTEWNL